MTKEEFKVIVKALKAVYSTPTFIPDKDAFNVWYELLKDLPYTEVSTAAQNYMATQTKIPTIADIRKEVVDLQIKVYTAGKGILSEGEAWGLVAKALTRSIYYYNEEFAKLPPEVQRAVGSAMNLHDIAASNDTNLGVEESLFSRRYREEIAKAKTEAKTPPRVQAMIDKLIAQSSQEQKQIAAK